MIPVVADYKSKRMFDVAGSLMALCVVAPIVPFICIAVKVSSPGPVIYRARRMARGGDEFQLLKFRTMRTASSGHAITARGDARITGVGKLLRAAKLDELPQLWNVLRGEMSLVGPRPEDPRYLNSYNQYVCVLGVRPGVTGAAAVRFRNEEELLAGVENLDEFYRTAILPQKLSIEMDYIEGRSLKQDLAIIGRTILAIVR